MSACDFEVGVFVRKEARYILEALAFHGYEVKWFERRTFLRSYFAVEGSDEAISHIRRWIIDGPPETPK